jgi:ADP-ribosyl-[dinitrogen reductase] hydrolase
VLTRRERIEGGLLGLLLGDAVGVPYEFTRPDALPPRAQLGPAPPAGFARAHARTPVGTYSDDGAQALCLLASLLERGRFDQADFAERLVAWYQRGYLAVDEHVFDVGVQTGEVLGQLARGVSVAHATRRDVGACGNGSLMRVLPLALWHRGSDAELVRDAFAQSEVTHGHPRAQLCCALYVLWVRRLSTGEDDGPAWAAAVADLHALTAADDACAAELALHIRPDVRRAGRGSGYVVDTLISARGALAAGPFADVIRAAIALGYDTDTTAAVAGGAAGVRDGAAALPPAWLATLRGREAIDPLLAGLLAHAAP